MQKVILQPCSNAEARKNYQKTIANYIELKDIRHCLTTDEVELINANYPNGKISIWGVADGIDSCNYKKWKRINIGDIAIFSWKGKFRIRSIVAGKFDNSNLSYLLWNDKKYKNIYLLDEIQSIDIPYLEFNDIVGYDKKKTPQSFQVLSEEQSALVLAKFEIGETSYSIDFSENDYFNIIEKISQATALENQRLSYQRNEQRYLRNYLFGGRRTCKCALCGRTFPVEFLIAAHIKRRADCALEEKKDIKNIVMPACKFGCDALYEEGYILVDNGIFIINPQKYISPSMKPFVDGVVGRTCEKWNDQTKKYFLAHNFRFGK